MSLVTEFLSPIGKMYIETDGELILSVGFDRQKNFSSGKLTGNSSAGNPAKKWLERYFNGGNPDKSKLKLSPSGTEFQKRVWKEVSKIPYGETRTYGEIAKELEKTYGYKKMSAQAVGGALGKNPISVIVPCHRVVGAKGKIVGYAGGVSRKQWLLELENAHKN